MKDSQLKINYRPVSDLIPYIRNSRTHSDEQVAQIAGSIREFGFTNPILIDGENGIIAGHGRVLAARKLNMAQVPCIELSHMTEAQKRAYVITDNKLVLNSGWDDELLRLELTDLKDLDFDLTLTGFSLEELDDLIFDSEDAEVDMPELPDSDKQPFQQKAFILHDEQAEMVDSALALAKSSPDSYSDLNENSNGNALAYICSEFLRLKDGDC